MAKGISGVRFIPVKRTERANIMGYPHRGADIGVMKFSGSFGDAQTAITPSSVAIDMKNTINIDKYMKRYMDQINRIFDIYSISCLCNRK